ncbi:MAG: VWA domain-containing protein [Treponema sp.]|nr:VWA domain-containing protein [Treponema sp.]
MFILSAVSPAVPAQEVIGQQNFILVPASPSISAAVTDEELAVDIDDIRIEQRVDGGFHLFIRKKPNIKSVLLTESVKDKAYKIDNYAYRCLEWNEVNGDEIRMLNGIPIPQESKIYSLVDSTPEFHSEFGDAFHIYIPYILHYGYEWARYGEVYITDGTFLNIRSFSAPYADYSGSFRDNPFTISVTQNPLKGNPETNFMKDAVKSYTEIVEQGRGDLIYSLGPADLVDKIAVSLAKEKGKTLDLVICIDTTNSMKDDIEAVRSALIPTIRNIIADFKEFRIGMVLYRDYFDEYLTKSIPFTRDFATFQKDLNEIKVGGGRDIPEAVYEALYDAAVKYDWAAEARLLILIGDAPPHPRQRGNISKAMVDAEVVKHGLKVNAILLPQ